VDERGETRGLERGCGERGEVEPVVLAEVAIERGLERPAAARPPTKAP
jgi:hypothetical protein